jgi:ATP-binding cassette subfamily B protein
MVALVGANGSGKSTVVKLLCRFYDPNSGSIEFNSVEKKFRVSDVRRLITVLFQESVRYNDTVSDNIAVGSCDQLPSAAAIRVASEGAGAADIIHGLPDGYSTLLGKSFSSGHDLSVGEWQRIALARAVLRESGILILDEPTSAMDSWAEAAWLANFRKAAQGQTPLVITHGFTTAMHADIIHVMSEGRIVESGSPTELLSKRGRYAQSWSAQTQMAAHV